jgi:hypothetical protein
MPASVAMPAVRQNRSKLAPTCCQASSTIAAGTTPAGCGRLFHGVALLRGFRTPSLLAQGGQRLLHIFNIGRDMPGICFGLATLVKSQILLLPVFIMIYDFWRSHQRKNVICKYLLLAGGILVVVIPWTARNYLVFDRFILVQSNGGYNLLMGNNKDNRWGGSTGAASEFVSMFPGIVADINHALSDEMGMNDRAATVALHFIMSNPVEVLKRVPYKLYRFFRHDPQGIGSLLRSNAAAGKTLPWLSSLFQISYWYYTVIFALAMLSPIMFLIGPRQTRAHFVLLSTIFYFALISAVFFGEGRFHIPLLPEFVGCMLVTLHTAKARLWPPATSTE